MKNHNHSDQPQEENWLDDILEPQELGEELAPDEHAVASAGLTHPADAKVEQILEEAQEEGYWEEEPEQEQPAFVDQEYRDSFAQEELPPEEAYYEEDPDAAPTRKRRPRMKKGYGLFGLPHLLATVIWLVLAIAIGVSLGRVVWVCAADLLAFGRTEEKVTVEIKDSDTMDDIALKLQEAGLIRYPELFKFYVQLTDSEEEISAGVFELNTLYDYHALTNSMSADAEGREVVEVMIPEGYSCRQIFNLLEENRVCTAAELEEYAASGELDDYWFLEGVERGDKYCLEGYLFPDTYQFYTNDEPERVLDKFLQAFDDRFTEKMHESLVTINETFAQRLATGGYDEEYIASHQITIREIVIIASLIEKESAGGEESYTISSVIYNRLANPDSFPRLQIDATVVYALGGDVEHLTTSDLQVDSPYNTYLYDGLPVGAICNPGRNSLFAALEPYAEETYYYYALNPETGKHQFCTSLSEFENFLASIED